MEPIPLCLTAHLTRAAEDATNRLRGGNPLRARVY
jgi:hypothetical protein